MTREKKIELSATIAAGLLSSGNYNQTNSPDVLAVTRLRGTESLMHDTAAVLDAILSRHPEESKPEWQPDNQDDF